MVYRIVADEDRRHAEEFRRRPIGPHSPSLQRVLNLMRLHCGGPQPVLICRKPFADCVIGYLPPDRSEPIRIEEHPVYASREAAEWALFCLRWEEHTGEALPQPLCDG